MDWCIQADKKYDGTGVTTLHIDFLRQVEKEFSIKHMVKDYRMTGNAFFTHQWNVSWR